MNIESLPRNGGLDACLGALGFRPEEIGEISRLMETDPGKAIRIVENRSAEGQGVSGKAPVPELDVPEKLDFATEDLEKILGLLQMDCDEEQLKVARERVESLKAKIASSHKEELEKIEKQLEAAQKAEKNSKIAKAFAWIGAALAVVAAVALTLVSGGAAAGAAIAGAVLAVTTLALQETGTLEKFGKALEESIAKSFPDMSAKARKIFAAMTQMVVMLAASALTLGGSGAAAGAANLGAVLGSSVSEVVSTAVNCAALSTGIVLGMADLGTGVAGTALNYKAAETGSEVKEIQAFLAMLQKTMEDEQDILQKLMQDLQNAIGAVIGLIEQDNENLTALTSRLGNALV